MKYNSEHKFDDMQSALLFVRKLLDSGFSLSHYEKDGGAVYVNGRGYKLLVAVR